MTRHFLIAGVLAVVLASCGIPLDTGPRSVSVGSAGQQSAASPRPGGDTTAALYFVKDDHLVPVDRDVTSQDPMSVLRVLISGPTGEETANGLISQIPGGTRVRAVRVVGKTALITLSQQFQNVIGTASVEAIAQVVFTTTELDPGTNVGFVVDGQRLKVTSPTRGDVLRVDECDFVSLLPTDSQDLGPAGLVDVRHLTKIRTQLTASCPSGPSS